MKTFYSEERPANGIFGARYRFRVSLCTSHFTGEAFHEIIVDAAETVKGLRGDWKRSSMYYGEKSLSVHCCESALEAAMWAANELGIESPAY